MYDLGVVEVDRKTIDGVSCVKMEPDMTCTRSGRARPQRSIPNGLTNPLAVIALRWIDAVQSN